MQVSKTALIGVRIYRVAAVVSLLLTILLFTVTDNGSTPMRTVVFITWMALCAFTCIRSIGDMMSKAHLKGQRFDNTLKAFEENTGSHESAVKSFYAMIGVSAVVRALVPVVLWFIFR